MKIIYEISGKKLATLAKLCSKFLYIDFPEPGDRDLYEGIKELNKENRQAALKHFEKASTYDNEYGTLLSAILYLSGLGTSKRDPVKALEVFKKVASESNNRVAQFIIGYLYLEGDTGIPQNKSSAIHWLLLAANNGWYRAMLQLGLLYIDQSTTEKNLKKALKWLEKVSGNNYSEKELQNDTFNYPFGNEKFAWYAGTTHGDDNFVPVLKSQRILGSHVTWAKNVESLACSSRNKKTILMFYWKSLTNNKKSNALVSQIVISKIYFNEDYNIPANISKGTIGLK